MAQRNYLKRNYPPTGPDIRRSEPSYGHHDNAGPLQPRANEKTFNVVVDNVPYMIKAIPFFYNGDIRYRISFNGSAEHVFTWDSSLGQLRAIDDEAATMPDNLEVAISEKLRSAKQASRRTNSH